TREGREAPPAGKRPRTSRAFKVAGPLACRHARAAEPDAASQRRSGWGLTAQLGCTLVTGAGPPVCVDAVPDVGPSVHAGAPGRKGPVAGPRWRRVGLDHRG